MENSKELFFYHSFPRLDGNKNRLIEKGLNILSSMVDSGLLLTPEKDDPTWQEERSNGFLSHSMSMVQNRICFTCLPQEKLPEHEKDFGPFSLEFSYDNFRALGGLPVIYLPSSISPRNDLSNIGSALVARLGEIKKLLLRLSDTLERLRKTPDKYGYVRISENKEVSKLNCKVGAAEILLDALSSGIETPSTLVRAINGLANLLCPTDFPPNEDPLYNFRLREWRIIAGMGRLNEKGEYKEITRKPENGEIETLKKIDPDFFETKKRVLDKKGRLGKEKTIAEISRFYSKLNGRFVLNYARRLIVPDEAVKNALQIVSKLPKPLEVVSSDDRHYQKSQ